MEIFLHSLVLALVQGITEFLPISSSGHLILVPYLLGWKDQGLIFDIAANTGTLGAVLYYFRKDVVSLYQGFIRSIKARRIVDQEGRLAWAVGIGTIPIGLIGLAVKPLVESQGRDPKLIAIAMIVFGLFLLYADRMGRRDRVLADLDWKDALMIGFAQAFALLPGTSRSGITMTVGMLAGFDRESSARFSFFLAIPVGILAALLDIKDVAQHGLPPDQGLLFLFWGMIGSGLAGIAVIHLLLGWLKKQGFLPFVIYRLALGVVLLKYL
ncbi:MAG: undecaprenyl-diphosphate phosphatase [Magnetococcales bacterium]|nr:undecaprenyl-diphosphate phosphatase [Magnetococcales bacterium]